MKLMKELSEAAGVPGNEEAIRKIIKRELKNTSVTVQEDALGNLIATKKSRSAKAAKLMIAAHMDEIGFYVNHVDKKGFLRVQPVGGFDPRNLFARRVQVHSNKDVLTGILNPGITPLHMSKPSERTQVPELNTFFVDLGLDAKVVQRKVQVGDMVTLEQKFTEIGSLWSGKALDNRCAVWLGIRFLQKLKSSKYHVHVVFSVQEEVGLRGVGAAAFKIEPDLAINLDTTLGDAPFGVPDHRQVSRLGEGACIKIMDGSVICDRRLVEKLKQVAKEKRLKYQLEVLPAGGTDTAAIQRSRAGVKSAALSIPTRNIHTVTECIHPEDLKGALKILQGFVVK